MTIKELRRISKKRADTYKEKAIGALEYYMDGYETRYPLWGDLSKVFGDLMTDDYYSALDHMNDIISNGYYADDVLSDYKTVKTIYMYVLKYVTYRKLQLAADNGIENLKYYEKLGY